MIMPFIKTRFNPGDRIWWVHCTGRIYEGIIGEIHCCDYQGALYCEVASPSFKVNPFPTVHYSNIFKTEQEAKEYSQYQTENPDDVVPMCMSCHYNDYLKQPAEGE
jgi:hypothetical protein